AENPLEQLVCEESGRVRGDPITQNSSAAGVDVLKRMNMPPTERRTDPGSRADVRELRRGVHVRRLPTAGRDERAVEPRVVLALPHHAAGETHASQPALQIPGLLQQPDAREAGRQPGDDPRRRMHTPDLLNGVI